MRPKRWFRLALTVLAVVTVAGSVAHARHWSPDPGNVLSSKSADRDADLDLSGVLSPAPATPIGAPVENLTVPLNSHVYEGQIIGETVVSMPLDQTVQGEESDLSPDEAGFALAQAQEDVRRAEADLEATSASKSGAEVQQAATQVAERTLEQRAGTADREFKEGDLSEVRYDRAVLAANSAVDAAEATRSQVDADNSAVSDATTRLQEARDRLAEAERQWQRALVADEPGQDTVAVVSPADGLLVRDQAAGTLGISSDPAVLHVETRISEQDLSKLRLGQPASVWLDSDPQHPLFANVSEIAESPIDSPDGPLYPVALSVDNPDGLLLAGELAHVRITGSEAGAR